MDMDLYKAILAKHCKGTAPAVREHDDYGPVQSDTEPAMTTDALNSAIEKIIPKNLDDLVRRNREFCTIRLSAPSEIESLGRTVIADASDIRDVISSWTLVCLDRAVKAGGPIHILSGMSKSGRCAWSTSPVRALDRGTQLVVTQSGSIYRLDGKPLDGEPGMLGLMHLAVMLNQWGWGRILGIPAFFY